MTTMALYGAAGKIGSRITERLGGDDEVELLLVEEGASRERLTQQGLTCVPKEEAARAADVVVLAVPDPVIGPLAAEIVPLLPTGALVIILDPAAPYAGLLPERDDVAYFVCHPAHPPIFPEDFDREALEDHFGSGHARQSIVCALVQGSEESYALGERLSQKMWGPVLRTHRVTIEQMAILEPALSETVMASCLVMIREAMDEAVSRGVPAEAARDFVLGHLRVELAILFDIVPFTMSDGAWQAIEEAKPVLFQPDWKRVFDEDEIKASVHRITTPAAMR